MLLVSVVHAIITTSSSDSRKLFSHERSMLFCICTSEKPAHLYTVSLNGIVLQIAVYGVREYLIKGTFLLKVRYRYSTGAREVYLLHPAHLYYKSHLIGSLLLLL